MFGQQKSISEKQQWVELLRQKAAALRPVPPQFHQPAINKTTAISPSALLQPASAKQLIQKVAAEKNTPVRFSNSPVAARPAELCKDTSYVRLLGITNMMLYIQSITQTSDNGILLALWAFDSTRSFTLGKSYGLLVKMDESANFIWLKQFEDLTVAPESIYWLDYISELPNKDILVTALLSNDGSLTTYNTIVYRLTDNGNLIWQNNLKNSVGVINSPSGTFTYNVNSAVEGPNNDIILCGTTDANMGATHMETVVRLDNAGKHVWDANYKNYGINGSYLSGSEGVSAFLKNGQIVLVGVSHGSTSPATPPAINFLTLDYNSGNELSRKFYRPHLPGEPFDNEFYKSVGFYTNKCTMLSNGHIVIYGKLLIDISDPNPIKDYFAITEFDEAFNLINAYTIRSTIPSHYDYNQIRIDESGKGLMGVFEVISNYNYNFYFGSFKGQQFQNQRRVNFPQIALTAYSDFAFLADGGYSFYQSYALPDPPYENYLEFRKMHDSDTSSNCMGSNVTLFGFSPLHIVEDPNYPYLDPNEPNKIVEKAASTSITDTLTTSIINPCKQINFCDTVKIHGDTAICGGASSLVFTSFKNAACGGITQWYIDSTAIDSMKVLTDSSVAIWFKNINWQGKLLATLPAGACYLPARDSVTINILRQEVLLDLGPDTVLCPNNSITLNAHNGFATYKWQDGSTDSTFNVTLPGKYWVDVSNACGNSFSDTIIVSVHAPVSFSLGPDLSICPGQNVTITAPAGFINYQWSSVYNIPNPNTASITVSPTVATDFMVQAEEIPGCYAYDTIQVMVQQTPPINLGNDTSICVGKSLILNAGGGFDSYQWNTGEQQQQISVTQKGTYIVTAVLNSCTIKDTLVLLHVYSLPVFTLGNDTSLCDQTLVTLAVNLPQATYQWSNGSTANQFTISQPGTYWLAATQNGCTSRDTIRITYTPMPAVNLGPDTTLCEGESILLYATNTGASYLWQDGSRESTLLVNNTGNYIVKASIGNCTDSDSIRISYISLPHFSLGNDTFICTGQQINLSPVLNTAVDYLWQDGSTGRTYTVNAEGVYSLQTINQCGSITDDIIITEGFCNIQMPNAFSPNSDGINDLFRVKFPFPVQQFNFSIFNRFGQKVFETSDINTGWDGRYRGVKQLPDNYVWTIQYTGLNNHQQLLKGNVLLLR